MTKTQIDGRYIIHPDGCGWVVATIRRGRLVAIREQSEGGTEPSGELVGPETVYAVVAAWDPSVDPLACVVERLA